MFNTKLKQELEFYKSKSIVLKLYLDFCFITSEAPRKEIFESVHNATSKKLIDEIGEQIFNRTQEACRKLLKDSI